MIWIVAGAAAVVAAVTGGVTMRSRRKPSTPQFDAFTVGEPWRRHAQGAQRAAKRLHATIDSADDGPLKDRMNRIGERLDEGLEETWAIARRGHQIDQTVRRLDPASLRSKLASLEAQQADAATDDLDQAIESVRSQLESVERLQAESERAADRLRLTQTRLDELVSRAAEVAIGVGDTDRYANDVDDLVIELESLRLAVEETDRA